MINDDGWYCSTCGVRLPSDVIHSCPGLTVRTESMDDDAPDNGQRRQQAQRIINNLEHLMSDDYGSPTHRLAYEDLARDLGELRRMEADKQTGEVTITLPPDCYRDLMAQATGEYHGSKASALRLYLQSIIEEHYRDHYVQLHRPNSV